VSDLVADAPERPGTSALRVGLTIGGIVLAAVVIFGLGVLEGSRVAERIPEVAAPPSALPTETLQPLPSALVTPATPLQPDKLTFYDRLSGVGPPALVALPEAPPPVQALEPAPPAAQGAHTRQAEAQPPAVTAVAAPRKTAPAAAAEAAAKTAPASKSDPAAQIRKLTGKGRFAVQVAAVSERAAAAETAALVKRNGFDAVIVMASVKGKILYRIRVGNFPNKSNAARAAEIFHSAFGFDAIPVEN
jgi:septal ring-binding cell division protein DamX